jgi:hypothetical protein
MKKLNIVELKKHAVLRGGKLVSKKYENAKTHLIWECSEGHRWQAMWLNISRGKWCPRCAFDKQGRARLLSIESLKQLAFSRRGSLISKEYSGQLKPLKWKCSEGHEWIANAKDIKAGSWCPSCSDGIGERYCRTLFERLLGVSFAKARPSWLLSPKGKRLELDGLNENLKIAFEHQGVQHETETAFFHRDSNAFIRRKKYDEIKRRECKKAGIILIEVPEIPSALSFEDAPSFISRALKSQGIPTGRHKGINGFDSYNDVAKEKLKSLQVHARSKGGECLSAHYIAIKTKAKWKCKFGHQWSAVPDSVLRGTWCPQCAGNTTLSLREIQKSASAKGGRCLSQTYKNSSEKLKWECAQGHKWMASARDIRSRSWCPTCAGRGKTIKQMHELAAKKGGKCTSKKYINAKTKLEWKCDSGHRWKATPDKIRRGSWCPACNLRKRTRGAKAK